MADVGNTPVLPETKAPRDRAMSAFFDLERPIRDAAYAAKILENLLEQLGECEDRKWPGYKSILVGADDWDAFCYAVYHGVDMARKSVETFDLACAKLKDPAPAVVAEGESRTP